MLWRAIMWSLPLVAIAVALFAWLSAGRFIGTDNAYVKGDRVYIATEISGPIVEVAVRENQSVSRGQLLFRLDDQPYRTALARIEAEIEIQRAEIRGLRAQWRTKREDIKAAQSQQNYAQADYDRQKDLADRKFAPAAKMEESRMGLEVARQRIASAEEDLQRIEAALAGDPKIKVDDHPKVKQMLAARDEALHNLRRTTIEAPLDGVVSKVLVPGSYAVMGVPSIAVVADRDLWIEANFKETELTRVRVGHHHRRHLSRHAMHREGDIARPVDRRGVRRAAAAERHRQLGQGGAAHPGPHLRHLQGRRSAAARRHERDHRDRHRPPPFVRRAAEELRPVIIFGA
jgi:membrane fusion protein (multidrug efflux system)